MTTIDWPLRERELLREFPDLVPSLNIDSLARTYDVVAVSGSVGVHLASTGDLTINGYRVPIGDWGAFSAIVRLQGHWGLELSLTTGMGRRVTLDVPLRAR